MDVFLSKSELRTIYKEKRMALSKDEVNLLSKKIFENFILQFSASENQLISVFLPIEKFNEVDTSYFINFLFENNNRVFVPKVVGDIMEHVEVFPDSEFDVSPWGIKEPVSEEYIDSVTFDLVLTPLLYCDIKGNRLGYGKGFYDKFFAANEIKNKIGLSFFEPLELISDINNLDIKLDMLITPKSVLQF